jgi:arsenite transporter
MWSVLKIVRRRLGLTITATMVLGMAWGWTLPAGGLKPLILPLTIVMILPMMVGMNGKALFGKCTWRLAIGVQAVNFVAMPAVGWLLGRVFFPEQPMVALGLLLMALIPTSGMTVSWTGFAKGNLAAATKMMVVSLLLGAVLTPLYTQVLMGRAVDVPLLALFSKIGLLIAVPLVLGQIARAALLRHMGQQRFIKRVKPRMPLLSTVGLLGIVFVAMALKARSILAEPTAILALLPAILLFYVASFGLSTLLARFTLGWEDAVAMVYSVGVRNLSVALALVMTAFGEAGAEGALVIAVALIVQVQAAAAYLKLAPRLLMRPPPVPVQAASDLGSRPIPGWTGSRTWDKMDG